MNSRNAMGRGTIAADSRGVNAPKAQRGRTRDALFRSIERGPRGPWRAPSG
jgi:hypothetical protein